MKEGENMIWFTSDLHLGHANIIHSCQRPFETIEEMNQTLIHNYNSMVAKNDTVYILGDLSFRIPVEEANDLIRKLKGKKILIRGNHDKQYDPTLFEGIYDFYELKGFYKYPIILMHYPMLEWPKSRQGSLHLHGHQHNKFEYNERMKQADILRYDVGVDANDYFPVSLNSIKDYMTKNI